MDPLTAGLTVFLYDNRQVAVLDGAVSLPVGARVRHGETDYVVHGVEVGVRETSFDLYYMCHMAEQVGADYPPV